MFSTLKVFLAGTLILWLIGCGGGKVTETPSSTEPPASSLDETPSAEVDDDTDNTEVDELDEDTASATSLEQASNIDDLNILKNIQFDASPALAADFSTLSLNLSEVGDTAETNVVGGGSAVNGSEIMLVEDDKYGEFKIYAIKRVVNGETYSLDALGTTDVDTFVSDYFTHGNGQNVQDESMPSTAIGGSGAKFGVYTDVEIDENSVEKKVLRGYILETDTTVLAANHVTFTDNLSVVTSKGVLIENLIGAQGATTFNPPENTFVNLSGLALISHQISNDSSITLFGDISLDVNFVDGFGNLVADNLKDLDQSDVNSGRITGDFVVLSETGGLIGVPVVTINGTEYNGVLGGTFNSTGEHVIGVIGNENEGILGFFGASQ